MLEKRKDISRTKSFRLTTDQVVAWTATSLILAGSIFNAFDIDYQKHLFFVGCILWALTGFLWRQPSLMLLNIVTALIYLVGWIA